MSNSHYRRTASRSRALAVLPFTLCVSVLVASVAAAQTSEAPKFQPHTYRIQLNLNFDELSYTGSERVTWVNHGDHPTAVIYFHLYSNFRPDQDLPPAAGGPAAENEDPRIEITEVTSARDAKPLTYSIDDQGTTLRVNLREPVAPHNSAEVVIGFRGVVPEVDPDETGLTSHVVQQVSAALRGDRETRRPRDLNFRCRGVMLLGTPYPVLVVQDRDDWLRRLDSGVGDNIFNEAADYEVKVTAPPGVAVYSSAGQIDKTSETTTFAANGLRDFAIIAGRNLRSEQVQIGETTLRTIFVPEHERIGKRVLAMAETSEAGDSLPAMSIAVTRY